MRYLFYVALIVIGAAGYIGSIFLVAWLEVKTSPKEPMYECPKHGFFRAKHLIEFMKDESGKAYQFCPICFDEKLPKIDQTI